MSLGDFGGKCFLLQLKLGKLGFHLCQDFGNNLLMVSVLNCQK